MQSANLPPKKSDSSWFSGQWNTVNTEKNNTGWMNVKVYLYIVVYIQPSSILLSSIICLTTTLWLNQSWPQWWKTCVHLMFHFTLSRLTLRFTPITGIIRDWIEDEGLMSDGAKRCEGTGGSRSECGLTFLTCSVWVICYCVLSRVEALRAIHSTPAAEWKILQNKREH